MSENEDPKPLKFSAPSDSVVIDEHPPKLVYLPGFEGTPVRGAPQGVLAPEELSTYRLHWDVHFRIFDMLNPEDVAAYERLMTAAASKSWVQVFKEIVPDDVGHGKGWKLGIKWGERFLEPQETGVFVMTEDTVGV